MTQYFPVVIEREDNGTFSAWIAGAAMAKRRIRSALAAHLRALQEFGHLPHPRAEVTVLRYVPARRELRFAGLGALLGQTTSAAKAAAARRNGRKGGRPRAAVADKRSA